MVYDAGVLVGYRWYDAKKQERLFPFGHGLSYTSFAYEDMKILHTGAERIVQVTMKNAGTRAGAEVVQLYVGMPPATQEPPQQLKGFEKVQLRAGESRTISLPLPDELLAVFDEPNREWRVFPGEYAVNVGASSRDIRQRGQFTL